MPDSEFTLRDLVESLEGRRRLGEDPPVLLLGSGASAAAGLPTMSRLYRELGIDPAAKDAFEQFCARMRKRNDRERYRMLERCLQRTDALDVTPGYRALAKLCDEQVFDVVLSANLDPLLEDALTATRLTRRDYLLLINGVLRVDRLPLLLLPGSPNLRVIKLHGDLFHRYMAWTPEEMDDYLRELTPALKAALNGRDVLVVGYSLRDKAVRELAFGTSGSVWYCSPDPPAKELEAAFKQRDVRVVTSADCAFEMLFPALARELRVKLEPTAPPTSAPKPAAAPAAKPRETPGAKPRPTTGAKRSLTAGAMPSFPPAEKPRRDREHKPRDTPAPKRSVAPAAKRAAGAAKPGVGLGAKAVAVQSAASAGTLDELKAAVVGVANPALDGSIGLTAFLLSEPRVIVTDAYNVDAFADPDHIQIVTQDGRRFDVARIARFDGNPFGPVVFSVPSALDAVGLRLSTAPVVRAQSIDVVVATSIGRVIAEGGVTLEEAIDKKWIDATLAEQIRRTRPKRKARSPAADAERDWNRYSASKGVVVDAVPKRLDIAPVGPVADMIEMTVAVAPGSSGAPVVDAELAVRGFIVAGSTDPKAPRSFMLPAAKWGKFVAGCAPP